MGNRFRIAACLAPALLFVVPATAGAASLTNAGGTLTYAAEPDQGVFVELDPSATPAPGRVEAHLTPSPAAAPGCSPSSSRWVCDGVTHFDATGSPGGDVLQDLTSTPAHLVGGDGDDSLIGGSGDDDLDAGAGDDSLSFSAGADTLNGGPGRDALLVGQGGPISITLDGIANDGVPGQGANVEPDIETVYVEGGESQGAYLAGGDAASTLSGGFGNDTLVAGPHGGTLRGNGGDDTLIANDGVEDAISCGAGDDTVSADQFDFILADCEHVSISDAGNHPPTVAWEPLAARVRGSATTTLRVDATDDKKVTSVKFLAGARTLCVDATAPFTCAYRPQGTDVGPVTLVAIASDQFGQLANATRSVTVTRFKASRLSLQLTHSRVARGKLSVSSRATCSGSVRVTAKGGGRTVRRTARLSHACRYSVRLPLHHTRVVAAFAGNHEIAPLRSSARELG